MNNRVWLKYGNLYTQSSQGVQVINELKPVIYHLNFDNNRNEFYLEEYRDKFHFGFKIYDLDVNLINIITKSWNNLNKDLGVLFYGVKGSGKTVTAKVLCNKLNLPVILVNNSYKGLAQYISSIEQECIFFFDEFEKVFEEDEPETVALLSLLDGVYTSPTKKMYLMTSNSISGINSNLIGRPSRIRYSVYFGKIEKDTIISYLEDNLINKDLTQDVLNLISRVSTRTIDTIKTIVEEINVHGEIYEELLYTLNLKVISYLYRCAKYDFYVKSGTDLKEIIKDVNEKLQPITSMDELDSDSCKYAYTYKLELEEPISSFINGESPFSYMANLYHNVDDKIIILQDIDTCRYTAYKYFELGDASKLFLTA